MNTKDRLYIAYGSNLNLEQMKRRCPTAEVVGAAELRNWRLWFRGGNHSAVATIERERGFSVPVLVWRIQPEDELALDRYEGFPFLYRKETLRITLDGRQVHAMAYIMNEAGHPCNQPSAYYFQTILEGYRSAGFDEQTAWDAVKKSMEAGLCARQ